MASYVLTYDLNGGEAAEAYRPLIAELQRMGSLHYQYSAWLVHSTDSADVVWRYFSQYLDGNDRLWVSEFTANCQASGSPGLPEWIAAHPPRQ